MMLWHHKQGSTAKSGQQHYGSTVGSLGSVWVIHMRVCDVWRPPESALMT